MQEKNWAKVQAGEPRVPPRAGIFPVRGCAPRTAMQMAVSAAVLYVASFFLPVVVGEYFPGYAAFVCTALSPGNPFFFHPALFASWFANPFLWVGAACFVMRRYGFSCVASGIGAILAGMPVVFTGATGLHVGYYAWISSMALMAVAGAVAWRHAPLSQAVEDIGPKRPEYTERPIVERR